MEQPRLPRLAYNWISSLGAFVAISMALVIIVMLIINFTMEQTSAYFGIFLYMVLPGILIFGRPYPDRYVPPVAALEAR